MVDLEKVKAAYKAELKKNTKKKGDCTVWSGRGFGENGYGLLKAGDVAILAHRAAFITDYGYDAAGIVKQSCGNKRCVTKDHLAEVKDAVESLRSLS